MAKTGWRFPACGLPPDFVGHGRRDLSHGVTARRSTDPDQPDLENVWQRRKQMQRSGDEGQPIAARPAADDDERAGARKRDDGGGRRGPTTPPRRNGSTRNSSPRRCPRTSSSRNCSGSKRRRSRSRAWRSTSSPKPSPPTNTRRATLAKAFSEITGIKLKHDLIQEGDVVEKLQTQMQSGKNVYDGWIND